MSALAPVHPQQTPQPPPADATGLLYERYSSRIFGYCLSLLGSREDAEDAVQTTFMNAQRGLRRGVVPEFELAWLFKIAQNVCKNRRVAAWRRGHLESARDLDTLQDALAGPERGTAVSVGELTRALAAIPERQRRALLLREWQGFSYDEIARELGVSVAAVETLLFRARRSVAAQLEQPETTRRRGVAASVAELFRWLFMGGGAPVKIAAATVAAAGTVTLAITPAPRDHAPARVRVFPQRSAPVDPRPTHTATPPLRSRSRPSEAPAPARPPGPATATRAPRKSVPMPTAASSPAAEAPAPQPTHTSPPATAADVSSGDSVAPPPTSVSLPSVEVESVADAAPTVPAVSLPAVELPPVEMPPLAPSEQLPSLP